MSCALLIDKWMTSWTGQSCLYTELKWAFVNVIFKAECFFVLVNVGDLTYTMVQKCLFTQLSTCWSLANATLSVVELMAELIEETADATSMCLVHFTGYPPRYSQLWPLSPLPSTGRPRLSSLPFPCQVTSAVSVAVCPKTTQAWSSDNARCTSLKPRVWQIATTAYATPKQSKRFPAKCERIL